MKNTRKAGIIVAISAMLSLCGLIGAESGWAANYYVATSGSDSNPGTETQPFRNLKKGIGVLKPGDTLFVKNGTYTGSSQLDWIPAGNSWNQPVTIAAYPGHKPVIVPESGRRVATIVGTQYVVFDGFIFDGAKQSDGIKITKTSARYAAHHIRIINSEIKNALYMGILVSETGADYNEFTNLLVYDNGTTDFHHGFYIKTSNNVIQNSHIFRNAGWGVHIYSGTPNYNIVRNNRIYENAAAGARGVGIGIYNGVGNSAYNNVIWRNKDGIVVQYGASSTTIFNNTIHENQSYGLSIDSTSWATEIKNNISYQNGNNYSDRGLASISSNNLTNDPKWVDPAARNYQLTGGSPAIDSGTAVGSVKTDFNGIVRPQGLSYDIGAHEFPVSSRPKPPSNLTAK